MEGFLMRRWEPILPGVRWLYVRSPANQRSASETGVSTPCGAVSTRGITVFVPRLSELKRYGRISNPGWETIFPGVRWLYVRSPANQRFSDWPVGLGFPHRAGRFRPVVPGWRWLYYRDAANQRSAGGVGVSTSCGAISTRGITVFVPGLSEL